MRKTVQKTVYGLFLLLLSFIFCIYVFQWIGIKPYIVRSGSMEPVIMTGSLCMVDTRFDYDDLCEQDIIAFRLGKTSVTHRVVEITKAGLVTKGDNNDLSDGITTTENNYIGKNIFSIPYLGYIISWLQTSRGRILVITGCLTWMIIQMLFESEQKN